MAKVTNSRVRITYGYRIGADQQLSHAAATARTDVTGTPIGNRIRRLWFERGEMTQEALAQACGVTRQTIIALEAGRYAPSLELAFRIARAFEAGIEDVFHWREE